jgi:hypothetical protein
LALEKALMMDLNWMVSWNGLARHTAGAGTGDIGTGTYSRCRDRGHRDRDIQQVQGQGT